ncbi:MAG: translation initiation factor IF-2 [Bacillales bacterium]|nr:translation initiation factor IF-2 [Bacillales bacterium]MDY6003359.1 translation initiation factor IF-2 [Bacilli bacterium]
MNNKNSYDKRRSNIPNGGRNSKNQNKVNNGVFVYNRAMSVSELAKQLNITPSDIIKFLFLQKKMVTINQTLDDESIGMVCLNFGYDFKKEKIVSEENFEELDIVDKPEDLKLRAPVVTVMGHVDHGKTTLIDAIRSSHLVDAEVGGISQAIGAYQKEINGQKITFLDTPGHEAFTAMRSRGAAVTDIVVLVVAADDGVMPQTIEAIHHAQAANVPIIVAVNKIDKDGANPDKIRNELMQYDIVPEEWGGSNIFCNISAKKKIGIDSLLEAIVLVAEMQELKANPNRYAIGTVIEANLDKGEGPKATLLVQNGTLSFQDYVVVGTAYGKIRRMTNEFKKTLKQAGPSTPVSVIGLSEVPNAGDKFMAFPTDKQAREIALKRKLAKEETKRQGTSAMSLEDLYNRAQEGEIQDINIIVKADTNGSAEAIKSSLDKLSTDKIRIHVIHCTSGAITESDIMLASASHAVIYGFNVRPSSLIQQKAEEEKVEIRLHRIIYDLLNEMQDAMKGMLKKEQVEKVLGQAEVRSLIKVSKVGTIAGCYVTSGLIKSNSLIRLLRNGIVVYEGKLGSLRRFKDDVKEVKEGFECGLTIENYNDLKEFDIVESYEMVDKD